MAKARILILLVAVLTAAANLALGDPVVKGIALCKQPLPGEKECYQKLENLVLVSIPDGKPIRLFPKVPTSIQPPFGAVDARLLDEGRLVLIDAAFNGVERTRYGYMVLIYDPTTGKLSTLTEDAANNSVVVSPNRKTVKYSVRGERGFRLWRVGGREMRITPPKSYEYSVRQVAHASHLLVTRSRGDGKNTRHFWLDEVLGTLSPVAENSLWLKGLDSCKGRYVYAGKDWKLWLVGPGPKKRELAKLEVDGEQPEVIWCEFSPEANYVLCNFGRAVGEPHINWASGTLFFDLRGSKPIMIKPDDDSDVPGGNIVDWYENEGGILLRIGSDLMWTEIPSLKKTKLLTLPDKCVFIDFARRDAPSPRGKAN